MQAIEINPVKVSFHFMDGTYDEKEYDNEHIARNVIHSLMSGKSLYETTIDGKPAFVPLHNISGAIIHPVGVVE